MKQEFVTIYDCMHRPAGAVLVRQIGSVRWAHMDPDGEDGIPELARAFDQYNHLIGYLDYKDVAAVIGVSDEEMDGMLHRVKVIGSAYNDTL